MMPEPPYLRFQLHSQLQCFQRAVNRAEEVISIWLERCQRPYVAFSTGKDSTCVLDLVWQQNPNVIAVYFDAQCAFPESEQFLERIATKGPLAKWPAAEPLLDTLTRMGLDNHLVEIETMRTTVWQPITTLLRQHRFDGVALGLRGQECYGRRRLIKARGTLFWQKRDQLWECLPLAFWSYDDVWAYIFSRKLDYCKAYDRMWDMPEEDQRLSYWAGETKRRWGRYAWLQRNYPELFNRLAQRLPEVRTYV